MKRFRLMACLAVLATFTTVFAAWELNNYADSYKDEAVMTATVVQDIETIEALSVEITNDAMPTVTYDAGAAAVSGDINVLVTENIQGAKDDYKFYYALYADMAADELADVIAYKAGDAVPATSTMKALEVAEDGTATIPAANIQAAVDVKDGFEVSEANLGALASFLETDGGIGVLVYAEKVQ